jgi:Zn finger protein HypA/HybF involved in hydrogenase expression
MNNEQIDELTSKNISQVAAEFTCICGKQKGWIYEDKETLPCPSCGRKYTGKYNADDLTIDAIEVK